MFVKELFDVLSPLQNIAIGDPKIGEPISQIVPLYESTDTDEELCQYLNDEVYGIAPKTDSNGYNYLLIFVEEKPGKLYNADDKEIGDT